MPMTRDHNNHEARPLYENTSVSACCTFSLSSPQQVIWLDQILRPENTCYNIGSVIHVEGELDETLLIRAVKAVVARHDALRLRLVNTQELPQQTVADTLPVTINIHDFSAYPDQEKRAEQHFHAVLTRPFDLNSGGLESKTSDNGLWRFELLRMGNQRWYWQFCSHHLIGDGTMLGLITEDITNTYSQLVRGEEITEPAPSYLDFVAEDVAYLDSARYRQDRQFWLERYENFPPPLLQPAPSLSSSSSLSHGASTTGKTAEPQHPEPVIHQFDSLFFQQIEALATAQGLSVLHFMYAVLACYFFRTTSFSRTDNDADSTEIVFGIPVHNRKNAKQKHTVGMFASVIPVGITLAADDTFLDIMHKAATELRRCYKHQRLPIAEINRHIQARQKTGQAQLFDIMLSYEQIEVNAEMPDATLSYTKIQRGAPFPLGIVIHKSVFTTNRKDSQKPTRLEFDYSPDYLNRAEVLTLQARLLTLAQAALFSPQQRVRDLPLSSPAEQQALVDFNASQMAFPQTPDTLVHSLFEQQAALHPDAIAVEFAEQTLSYGELNRRANRLAHHLIALGVRPDERVAICVERSPEMIVGLLAILKAGGAYVPLDPAYPAERLNFMLKDSAPVALLTQRALAQPLNAALPAAGHATLLLDAVFPDTDAAELAEQPAHNPEVQGLAAHHLAYVIYTSGSTGLPKGVEMPLAALSNLLLWHRHSPEKLTDTGKTLQFAALGFDVAFQEIFTTLCEGGCLVLINEAMRREPQQFLKRVQQQQIERLFLPYIALQHLAEADSHHHPNEENDLSCLKHIITAGEQLRMTPAITQLLQRAKNCRLHNHYGPTESHVVTAYTLEKAPEHWPVLPPIGRPIANTRIYILDAYGQPVPPGVTGEIYIAGKCVARGYLNRPELTAERFLPDPFCSETNSKMYKTGDLGRWLTDGNIDYLGRNDFQIKLRGFRIEPGEIEAKLMLCHGVREAAVIVREDEPNQKRLVAYVCPLEKHSQEQRPQDDITLLPAALRAQLSTQLAEYMLPSAFVILDTLPLTPNGKLDRKALPAPDLSAVVARSYVAPVGETETMLAQIWQGLLGLERVGRHDHFFELGGHSLLAVQLAARVRQIMGRELPLRRLFAQPVLMDLAQVITATEAITQAVIPLADRSQPLPLSFAQQRLWFLNQLDPASSLAYHIPVALQLHGQLDRHALTTALDSLVARHESLRTRLVLSTPVLSTPVLNKRVVNTSVVNKSVLEKTVSGAGQPCQAIDPADTGFTLSSHDLRPLDPVLHSARITELTEREARTAFDFAQSPLIRGHLLQLADEAHLLLLTVHHIIADGWSIGIFVRELGTLYHAILTGDDAPLPPLPVQYADYALWQREWLQNNLLTEQQDFWRSRLQDAPALLSLPTDSPRPAVQTYVGSQVPFLLDKSVVTALKTLGKQHDTTLFMTLLAGWSIVLARLSGQDDIVIGTPVANRPLPEFEGLIGFFVNTLALRISVNDDLSVAGLLAQVREQALAAYAHQDLPFEQVVEALQPERSLSYSPIFQVMLALDNTPVQAQTSADLQISRLDLASRSAHFDLLLLLTETDDGLTGGLEYAADLFDAATAERMVGYLVNILTAMTADAAEVVTRLPMLPASERQQLLVDFNATQTDFTALGRPQNALIHQLFERQAALCPAATAVIGGDQMLTYDELNRDANRLAHHLIALGIQPDDRVAICVERSPAMIVGLLGILKAGGAYVPLDPAYPADRLSFMLEDAAPAVILTQTSLSLDKQLADTLLTGKLTRTVPMVAIDNLLASTNLSLAALNNPDPQALGLNDRHLAYIIYTSGSTGLPKGVAIEHRNTVNFLNWAQTAFNPAELAHTLFATSLNFDLAVYECFAPLLSGGTVHLVPDVLSLLQPEFTGQTISLINTVPSAIARLAETHAVPDTVQTINLAGEALKSHLAEQLLARTNIQSVCNLYGPSETTTYSTWTRMDRATGFQRHIGRPIANTRIYILDPHGQPVPLGVSGEIYIAGNGVARGYLNRPELTAERFLPDPFFSESDGKMYQTGDLGRWLPDGNIEYLGRNDFQVKIRGFRIELGEIEARLMQCHGVREAIVLAREDELNQKRLVAYLRLQKGSEQQPTELRAQLAKQLAEYMLPSAFVILDAFPLTPNGKLDRQALPAPDASALITRHYEAPSGEKETVLAQIWQDLLGLAHISRHDHFFELGGHSLMIVSLIERLHSSGWQLDVRGVFSAPVLAAMAQALQGTTETVAIPPNRIPDGCTAITPDMLTLVRLSQAEIDAIVASTPGGAANIQDIYPLAPLQEGILFHHLLQTQGDTYLLHCLLSFESQRYLDGFLSGFQQVIDRHDILRTAACWQGLIRPVQVVWRQAQLSVSERSQQRDNLKDDGHCFDLSRAPLFMADTAYDPASGQWLLTLRFHHMIADHMTLELIFDEIARITRINAGTAETLPAVLPYRNFIAQVLTEPAEAHEAYFRAQLADIDTPTAPFGVLAMQDENEPIIEAHHTLDSALAAAIRSQSRRYGVSPGVLFHVAWAQVLAQTSDNNDNVVFGSVLSGRLQSGAGAARTLGMFINTLPVRISLAVDSATDNSVQAVVQATYRNLTALLEHEQAPLTLAQQCSGIPQTLPLFSTLLNYRHSQQHSQHPLAGEEDKTSLLVFPQLGMRLLAAEERTNYPVTLSVDDIAVDDIAVNNISVNNIAVADMGGGFRLTAQTVTRLDPARMNSYLVCALNGLVEALEHTPHRPIGDISVLPAAEQQQVLVDFNATRTPFFYTDQPQTGHPQTDSPQTLLIHQLFEAQVKQRPDAVALTFESGTSSDEETVSYAELNRRANQLAHHLLALGVQPDDRVAICVERSPQLIVGLLAILKAGGAYLPLDPAYPADRLLTMLEDAKPIALLTQTAHTNKLPTDQIPTVMLDTADPFLATQPAHNLQTHHPQTPELTSRHLAYVIYTSGSTGQPKGVMVEHRNVLNLINNDFADISADDCVAHCANIAFDASTWEIWSALLNGGRLHVVAQAVLLDPVRFCDSLISGKVTALWLTAGLFNQYHESLRPLFGQLRYLLVGGDVLDAGKIRQVQMSESRPAHLLNGYGPTETTTFATTYAISAPVDAAHAIPIGRPLANARVYILDRHGKPVPAGVAGEIYIAGAGVARGYLNRPELTAERFLPDPFSPLFDGYMYKTGDLGRWLPNGNIDYLGRNDFQIKLRGFRIEPGEIEARLMQCQGVRQAVVIAREDEAAQKRLVAYVQPLAGALLLPAALRQQLAQHLADVMLPSAFVILDTFPLTPNGKLDRQALPAPDLSAVVTHGYEAPEGETETALAQIWQTLLDVEQVGRHDHFFELGGHSLLAVQLIAYIRQQLARELSLQQLFDQPRLRDLAQVLSGQAAADQTVSGDEAVSGNEAIAQTTIPVADRNQPLPLSFAQQRLWFLAQLDPAANLAYHIPLALRLTGSLSHEALRHALDNLVARHEILRTRFVPLDGHPYQQIEPANSGFTLPYHDLRPFPPEERTARVAESIALEAQTPFDFTHAPLIRGHLLQLTDKQHILLLTHHHIISDGWSVGVLLRELDTLYRAALAGLADPLPPLPIQYADYAVWQRNAMQETAQAATLTSQRHFWCEQLAGIPALLSLPVDKPRPSVQSFTGGRIPVHVDSTLLAALKTFGQRHNSTLFMTLMTAWSIVLARLSGQDDIVIGTPVANRPHQEQARLIGFFVNTLALRVRFHDELSVADLLSQIRQQALAAYAHQDLPFEQVVEALQPERNLSYSPIFQVMLALNNTPAQALTLPELQSGLIEPTHPSAHFDLTLSFTETDRALTGELTYAADLFNATTADRIAGYVIAVLREMVADETQRVSTLPMLPASERQQLLVDFNATSSVVTESAVPAQERLIHELFEAQVLQRPDAVAVVYENQTLSYGELNRRANQLAHHLIALGVQPDERVAVCTERNPDMVIALLAILKAGGAYLPLDPSYPPERLNFMLEDAAPVALLVQASQAGKLISAAPVVLLDKPADFAGQPDTNPAQWLTSRHLAYVIYTSGSTGQPKGVMIEHHSLCNLLSVNQPIHQPIHQNTGQQPSLALTPASRVLQFASNSFDACIWECGMALLSGASLYLARRDELLPGAALSAYLARHAISHVLLSPTALAAMDSLPDSLQTLLVGGEACPPSLVKRWSKGRQMLNAYGPTEITVCATLYPCDDQENTAPPIGRPIANTRIYILDSHGQPVPLGVTGEIYIAGAGVARGYLNRPDLTAERFLPEPFSREPDAHFYRTGDLGRWRPDGNIEYLGRDDFQIKLRGFRIEPGEIEARLRQCAGVREALVIAAAENRLVAYLLPEPGAELVPTELRAQLARHLAEYMLPAAFITLDGFPLTPNGKLDRQTLPAPDLSALAARHYAAPEGETETLLAHIWQKLLGLEQVSRHDHFFELGGHSLMIVSLIAELHRHGWQLDVRSVFATPVLAEMAQAAQRDIAALVIPPNRIPADCTVITPDMLPLVALTQAEIDTIVSHVAGGAANVQDIYPLAPLQEGILFHHLLQPQGDDYLLQILLAFDSRERLDTFLQALQQVIDRHDILRTAVDWQDLARPVQVVWRQAVLPVNRFIPVITSTSSDDVLTQLRHQTDPRRHRIDLTRAPLFAADFAQDELHNEWLLSLRFHHFVSDHVTLDLIFAEIARLQRGETLPESVPYRNFIAQTLFTSRTVASHEAYFREQLADIDEPTAPFGILTMPKRSELPDYLPTVARSRVLLDDALSTVIRAQARRLGVSPGVLFHVAWAQVLAHTTGRHDIGHDDVVFGSVLLGRLQGGAGAEQILGMFVNTLPVRISLGNNSGHSVQDVVQNTYRNLTDLLEHEQAPLALAQQCSGVAQPMPLFSTLLNYRHSQTGQNETDSIWSEIRIIEAEERTNYPITLSVDDLGQRFQLTALTIQAISPESITTYLATAIAGLVEALSHNPQQPILAIPILPAAERQRLLVDFNHNHSHIHGNNTQADFPQNALIHQLVETQALQRPDAIALTFEDQTLSYGELNRRANRLAHRLIALGVRPDDRVAICLERRPEMVVGLLAILKAGGAYLPLDPSYPAERLQFMLEDATPVALLTQAQWRNNLDNAGSALPTILLDHHLPEDDADSAVAFPADNPDIQAHGLTLLSLAYVIYTSGSTGRPKGVMVEHRNVLRLIINNGFADIGPDDCIAHCANVAFDAATWEIWGALAHGARVLLIPEKTLLEPARFGQCLSAEKVSALFLTTALFNQYASLIAPALSGLRYVLFGGEKTDTRSALRLRAEHPPQHLLHVYGPTETTTFATFYDIPLMDAQPDDREINIPIGRPIGNTQIYILDKRGQPVPVGVSGEIYIGGAGVARGYLNRPELTAERFLPDPFSSASGARMYKTGDLGRWLPEGNIEYLNRNDFQVKLRGFRIELGEIETRLRQCHGVREALVLVHENATHEGNANQKRLIAYLQPEDGIELLPAELRTQLAQHLADYMIPSAFVLLESFPLTPNGKIDRKTLPVPDASALATRDYAAPTGETEMALAQIWQDILGLEQVSRHDHFFELGGHSLLAIQLVARVRQLLARELPLQQLFDQPVLMNLALALSENSAATPVVIPLADRQQQLPLSFAQQRLWFLAQLDPAASLAYHIPLALRLTGQLNHAALRRALNQLVARQESLRTRFMLVAGQPCQVIEPSGREFPLAYEDLRSLTADAHKRRIDELAALESETPFDLTRGPLVRGHLLHLFGEELVGAELDGAELAGEKLAGEKPVAEEHVLLITQHHIISDGWSIGILLRELEALYRAILTGQDSPLAPLPVQYADYAVWQRNGLQETVLTAQRNFWCQQLNGASTLLTLPTDRPRPAAQNFIGARVPVQFDANLVASLKALGQRHNSTLFMTLLTGWSIVLSRLSGQDCLVIGTPVANRPHQELEGIIGFFVNTLALRVTPDKSTTVAELLAQVRETAFAAYANQDLPFEQVVEAIQPERSLSYSPIFQVMLALNNTPVQNPLASSDLQLTPMASPHHSAHFDITLSLTETSLTEADSVLIGELAYAVGLFDAATIERMSGYLTNILTAMVADESQSIMALPMLPESERQQLLSGFNPHQGVLLPELSDGLLHQRFEAQAAQHPDAIALVFGGSAFGESEFGEQTLSYGELNRRANRLAHQLIALGIRPDDRVAICTERNLEMVVGILAILKAGGAYLPLDPAYPAERLNYMLEDAAPVALLVQDQWRDKLCVDKRCVDNPLSNLPTIRLGHESDHSASFPADNPNVETQSHHLAYVIYTSGSTGKPKGVMVEHAQVMRLLAATQDRFRFDRRDIWTLFHSFAFDFSVWELWGALAYGGRLVVVSAECARSPQQFYTLLCREQVTVLNQTPSAFRQLIAAQDSALHDLRQAPQQDESLQQSLQHRLRCIIFGGEALELHTLAPWVARNPTRQTRLVNMYGITEITVHATYRELTEADIHSGRGSLIGQPLADLRIYILDANGQPAPLGATGELYIAGAGVTRGYLNRPELTAERFLPDPFCSLSDIHIPEKRMYRTGDLGRWLPDGNIDYLGRNDFQVKIRGFRIELGEIEARLEQCPGVREATVLARNASVRAHDGNANDQKRLVAWLLPEAGVTLVPAELRAQLAQHLADYMLPSAFVTLDAFPLTPNGKLDSRALPEPDDSAVVIRNYASPLGETETTLAQIWQDLLGLARVGRHDHFFELGGHSLMIVSLIEALRHLGWQLDVRSVFMAPVLADMARAIRRESDADLTDERFIDEHFVVPANRIPADCTAITPDMLPLVTLSQAEIDRIVATVPGGAANIQDIYPLSPLQEGILFHHLLQAQGDNYLLQSLLAFDSRERLDAFLTALQQVIDRHDILRTAAYWQDLARPVQVVWRQATLIVNRFTPAAEPATKEDVAAQLKAHTDPRRYRLDLNRAPLFTADIAYDPASHDPQKQGEWLMALRFHHLVSDHMTLELIFTEIALLLKNKKLKGKKPDSLPAALPAVLPYRNFIAQTLSVPESAHEDYFRTQLADIHEPTAPFGVLRIQPDGDLVTESHCIIDPVLADGIRTQARRMGVSAGTLFHVAWAQVLAKTSGHEGVSPDNIVFGSVLSGRLQGGAGAQQVLGMFINTLPIRISLANRTVQDVVQETFHSLMLLLEHEQAPLVLAQRCSGVPQSLPLFSTLLNYRHSSATDETEALDNVWNGIRVLTAEERTNYPITLSVDDLGHRFRLNAQAVAGIDPDRVTAYLVTALSGLVEALARHSRSISPPLIRDIAVLPASERQQLLIAMNVIAMNANQAIRSGSRLIHTLFEDQAARQPDAIALTFSDSAFEAQTLNYGELNHKANQLAHYLLAQGVQPDDRVAICLDRSPELIIGLLAILKAGGAYLPLDPAYPAERLGFMLEDAAPVVVLTQTIHADNLRHCTSMPIVALDNAASLLAAQPAFNPDIQTLKPHHLAYVIYTSGSTGQPKGVMVEHRNIHRLVIDNGYADIGASDCVAHCANIAFDASTWEIWSALLNGGRLHIVPQPVLLDPARFCRSLMAGQVTALWLTVGLFNEYHRDLEGAFRQLRYLLVGGDKLDAKIIQAVKSAPAQPVHLINGYGPTETTTFAATYAIPSSVDADRSVPIGRPIANSRIYILDEDRQPVPFGVVSEIYIGGTGVSRGYLNQPALTAERFLTDPFCAESEARIFRTGDLGRWLPDGNIEYFGRNDFQVKLRGFRIEPGEIEARLEQCHGVRRALVLLHEDMALREDAPNQKRLVAYLQPEENAVLVPADLRRQLALHLADYMLPAAFVTLEAFPLTPNGKLDRRALPAPELSAVVTPDYQAPQGRIETALARIWQELLGLAQVGRHDHFFELGGHSLMVVRLITRIKSQFMVNVPLTSLFASPELQEQADLIFAAQINAVGESETHDLDAMSAEELMALLGEDDINIKNNAGGDNQQ